MKPFVIDAADPTPEQRFAVMQARKRPVAFEIWQLWNHDLTAAEIAERIGWTPKAVSIYVTRMRGWGWHMPYRRREGDRCRRHVMA